MDYNGKYLTIIMKPGNNPSILHGILDTSEYPQMKIGDEVFDEADVCSMIVGAPEQNPRPL